MENVTVSSELIEVLKDIAKNLKAIDGLLTFYMTGIITTKYPHLLGDLKEALSEQGKIEG